MQVELDGTTLSCPLLFVKFKQLVNKANIDDTILIKLNDEVSMRDILRYANKNSWQTESMKTERYWQLKIIVGSINDTPSEKLV
ncbi:sulfurtransferase TusA family protein [Flocculibacter collagenilyticus]|uniref:sulfurtransferase TusA family protein n=1 Tax=Flocculibacter collagenilyticus TaxID=2744479 RepID=UPI0018F709C1|nr:sulfurtransferase TusA family protein [Flocculibacter collagenilyticus]